MKQLFKQRVAPVLCSMAYIFGLAITSIPHAHAAVPNGATLNTHAVMVDDSNKIVSWVSEQDKAYDQVVNLAWNYLLHSVPTAANGKPAYYSYSYMDPSTQQPVNWPHNPAGLYAMIIESAANYYAYSGNSEVLTLARGIADNQLANGMTLSTDNWANVPYASGDAGSLTYQGASYGDNTGTGDGTGVIEPDKIGEFGHGLVQLYKLTGDARYLNAAINAADALASHIRTGSATQSPWPFRVTAANNTVKEQYTAHVISPIELFDDLIGLNTGNTSTYQSARGVAWTWMMTYPMQNNAWSQYFEDVGIQSSYNANLNQMNAMMTARYLLQHPETDPSWETHVRGLITWVEQTFGTEQYGAKTIKEQQGFPYEMGSHTSRYASVNTLLYERTGDTAALEKAYRAFNWATYMTRSNGVVIDGPSVNNQWFTDGYGDYIRHFLVGMASVPSFAPNGQTHLLRSSSVVQTVDYQPNILSYHTFNTDGIEVIKVDRIPSGVALNGIVLAQRTDLNAEGWTYNGADGTVRVRRDNGNSVTVAFSGSPTNQAPSISIVSPAANSTFTPPASFQLAANATDADGSISKVEFYQGTTLLCTATLAPYTCDVSSLPSGTYNYTARAYDNENAITVSSTIAINVSTLPAGWLSQDIGAVGVAGSTTTSGTTFTVKGSGVDIWGNSDSFQFAYTSMNGDGEVKARVASQQNTDQWALAGVMIRETLDATSKEALAALTPSNGFSFDYRSAAGGATTYVNGGSGAAPNWVRLVRSGTTITAYKSTNGTSWTSIGSTTISMSQTVYVGLAVTSHVNTTLTTDTFDNISVTGSADTQSPAISSVSAGSINQNGGSISWNTDEPSTSQIEYGTTTAYGSTTSLNSTLTTTHSQVVSGLDQDTTYHYRVRSADAAGNVGISGDYTFHTQPAVDTTAPSSPSGVTVQALSPTSVKITWQASTDNVGVASYTVLRNDSPIATVNALTFTDINLAAGQTYVYTVVASDAAGNTSAVSAPPVSITLPTPDTTAPVVALSAPTTGTIVSGTVAINATATDDTGVTGVQFMLDGANLGSEVTSSPYQASWDTTGTPNGTHTLTAVARDAAGNTATAAAITVTVNNTAAALTTDVNTSFHQSTAANTIVSPNFSTSANSELLVAFITSDGPSGTQTFKTVTGGGLTWTLRKRANTRAGTSEIWTAQASSKLTNAAVTATRNSGSYTGSITVVSFIGASTTIGATASANGSTGAPTVSLTTTQAGSWVWGVGNDWDGATARTVPSNQTLVDQYVASGVGDTFWVQRLTAKTATAGSTATLNDTSPTNHRWNYAAIEILPAQ